MPRIERIADVSWEGNLARGEGRISAGSSGAFDALAYSNATRIGHPPGRIDTSGRIVMDEVEGQGHQIVGSVVTAAVAAPGLDEAVLAEATRLADEGCPFSALLKRSGATVEVHSQLGS